MADGGICIAEPSSDLWIFGDSAVTGYACDYYDTDYMKSTRCQYDGLISYKGSHNTLSGTYKSTDDHNYDDNGGYLFEGVFSLFTVYELLIRDVHD